MLEWAASACLRAGGGKGLVAAMGQLCGAQRPVSSHGDAGAAAGSVGHLAVLEPRLLMRTCETLQTTWIPTDLSISMMAAVLKWCSSCWPLWRGAWSQASRRGQLTKRVQPPLTGSALAPRADRGEHRGATGRPVMAWVDEPLLGLNPWAVTNRSRKGSSWILRSSQSPLAP